MHNKTNGKKFITSYSNVREEPFYIYNIIHY